VTTTTTQALIEAIRNRASGQTGPEDDTRIARLAQRASACEHCAVREHEVTPADSHVRVYSDNEKARIMKASGAALLSIAHGGRLVRVCERHYSEHALSIWSDVVKPLTDHGYVGSLAWELCPDWAEYAADDQAREEAAEDYRDYQREQYRQAEAMIQEDREQTYGPWS